MNFLGVQRPIDPVHSETIFHIGSFPVNNSTLAILLIVAFVILFYLLFIRKFSLKPNKKQVAIELIVEALYNFILQITSSKRKAAELLPVVGSVFTFILLSNLISVTPILGSITFNGRSIFRAPTADFNTTFSLALGSLLVIHFSSARHHGFFAYIGRFFKFHEVYKGFCRGIGEGFISIIDFFIGLLDIIGEFARIISLSLRLFGNIYAAGLVLGTVITGMVAYAFPAVFTGLGMMFSVIQAVVFSALITVYYTLSLPENYPESIEHENEVNF